MDLQLNGKTVLVTGGSGGIGLAAVKAFLNEGAKVAFCGRNREKLQKAVKELSEKYYTASFYARQLDISDDNAFYKFIDAAAAHFGAIDSMVFNAAIDTGAQVGSSTDDDWKKVFDVNVHPVRKGIQRARKYMKFGGSIVVVSSFAAKIPSTATGVYSVSKAAEEAMVKVLASELASSGIRVVAVRPGMTDTDIIKPLKERTGEDALCKVMCAHRLGKPEEVANCIVFAASDAASFITGTVLEVSGGRFAVQDPLYSW